jgi:ribulose-phosphate 3-epimerase
MPIVAPSLLAADFANLRRDIEMVNDSEADWFHCDIMDGVFVPNFSFGIPVIKSIKKYAKKPLDVHLMIIKPERYFEIFKDAGADILTIHYEASTHLHRSIEHIRSLGMKPGVVLNPHTPVTALHDIIGDVDMVLLMSVNPGYGGQEFIGNTYRKITELKAMISSRNLDVLIEVDGGVGLSNAASLVQTGVDVLVAGNTVFSSANPTETIARLKSCC